MTRAPSLRWYARPVLFVSDMDRSIAFYVGQLGFKEHWRHDHEGKTLVAQVDRQSCELILSSQEPDRTGRGRMFISLEVAALDAVRAELEGRGVAVQDGGIAHARADSIMFDRADPEIAREPCSSIDTSRSYRWPYSWAGLYAAAWRSSC